MERFIISNFFDGNGQPHIYLPKFEWNFEHAALDEILYLNWELSLSYVNLYTLYRGQPVNLIYGNTIIAFLVRIAPFQYEIRPI